MSVDGFHVDTEILVQHARRLSFVSEAIGLAADAARQVDLNDGAFGFLCGFLPWFVNGAEASTGDAISASLATMDAIIDSVVGMAADCTAVDESVESQLTQLTGGTT